MRICILGLLLGASVSAQSPVQEKDVAPPASAVEKPGDHKLPDAAQGYLAGRPLQDFLEKREGQSLQVWRRASRLACSVPLKNVLRHEWRAPSRSPDEPMIRPLPPASGGRYTIRQVPLPAPSCDDVK